MLAFRPPAALPSTALPDLDGVERPLGRFWADGPALVLVGHRDCTTTRLSLRFVDRIHAGRRAGTGVVAVLQDDPETARELIDEFGLRLPIALDVAPYDFARELGLVTVPTLFLVGEGGRVEAFTEGFKRADLEGYAARLGFAGELVQPGEKAPAQRPG